MLCSHSHHASCACQPSHAQSCCHAVAVDLASRALLAYIGAACISLQLSPLATHADARRNASTAAARHKQPRHPLVLHARALGAQYTGQHDRAELHHCAQRLQHHQPRWLPGRQDQSADPEAGAVPAATTRPGALPVLQSCTLAARYAQVALRTVLPLRFAARGMTRCR